MREGCRKRKSQKIKRRLLGTVLRIGTMTGLFDVLWWHSAVLTNFTVNVMESRLYWPGGGIPKGPCTGRVLAPDRARRVVQGPAPPPVRPLHPDHPLQPPWGFRGPLRCRGLLLEQTVSGWVPGITHPVLPTRYTPPRYPPGYTRTRRHTVPLPCSYPPTAVSDTL